MKKFYITTTLPYVNAAPHLGFALELIQADITARYHKSLGEEVIFNTGTDEHGLKIYRSALDSGKDPQAYTDEYAAKFERLKTALDVDYTHFIRTTNSAHKEAAQEFWRRCDANGFIYNKIYAAKYCVGCELEKTDSELVDGRCPLHPNLKLEIIEEENYFFKFSQFQKPLLELYEKNPNFVLPDHRLNEIRTFVERGPQDFSISRLKEKMPWGIPVPGDDAQVMYVWFDALINYISTLGWPASAKATAGEASLFEQWWGTKENPNAIQIAGKDNLRQQSAIWQAMLLAADLPPSKQILIHGFITSGGQKMSKSLGNVVDPYKIVEKYGTDALRYWIAREANTFEDSDFTWEKFKESYNANLANGLGNLASRVMKMAATNEVKLENVEKLSEAIHEGLPHEYVKALEKFDIQVAANILWSNIARDDAFIQKREPFKKIKTDPAAAKEDIQQLLFNLLELSIVLQPFLPVTSEKILEALKNNCEIKPPLFPRME